jgi:hypothetical protein
MVVGATGQHLLEGVLTHQGMLPLGLNRRPVPIPAHDQVGAEVVCLGELDLVPQAAEHASDAPFELDPRQGVNVGTGVGQQPGVTLGR